MSSMEEYIRKQQRFWNQLQGPMRMIERQNEMLKRLMPSDTIMRQWEQMERMSKMASPLAQGVAFSNDALGSIRFAAFEQQNKITNLLKTSGLWESLQFKQSWADRYFQTNAGAISFLDNQMSLLNRLTTYVPDQWIEDDDEDEDTEDTPFATKQDLLAMEESLAAQIDGLKQGEQINWQLYIAILSLICDLIFNLLQTFQSNPAPQVHVEHVNQIFIDHGYEIEDMPTRIEDGNDLSGGEES